MRLILIVIVVTIEALTRFLFPRANRHSRPGFEEPKRSGRPNDPSGSGIPAVPNRPSSMSGGAAVSMEFDE